MSHGESPLIDMQEVWKIYDTGGARVEALRGINLSVAKGEYAAIVGSSGSGKSTLMNLMGCLDTPTSGSYRLGGEEVRALDREALADIRNRRVGFVFQGFNLLPHLTAFQNVELPLLLGSVPKAERTERAEALLVRVGLADRTRHRPAELSGGQMQRVAIARALAMDPDIVLADEPTGNLDTSSGRDIFTLFDELWNEGHTVIVITHDPALARRTPRLITLRDGQAVTGNASSLQVTA